MQCVLVKIVTYQTDYNRSYPPVVHKPSPADRREAHATITTEKMFQKVSFMGILSYIYIVRDV